MCDLEFDTHAIQLHGGDDVAQVFLSRQRIIRKYSEPNFVKGLEMLNEVEKLDMEKVGIVPTWVLTNDSQFPFSLQHKRLTISLPQHWSVQQLKDALLHTLSLSIVLDQAGLALKDFLPENVAFSGSKPFLVDFSSIVRKSDLLGINWLKNERGQASPITYLLRNMLVPYFVIPLFSGYFHNGEYMQKLLRENYCNSGNPVTNLSISRLRGGFRNRCLAVRVKLFLSLFGRSGNLKKELKRLERMIVRVDENLGVSKSHYSDYYDEKEENFSLDSRNQWQKKQVSVAEILKQSAPNSVLDIGCNTGWFSILSALQGAEVTSLDSDTSSIDVLYRETKKGSLRINPQVMTFEDLINSNGLNANFGCAKPTGRILPAGIFKSDLVMALGIIHHLCLGSGYKIDDIFQLMSLLTDKTLVIEFVAIEDSKIQGEPSFFPNIKKMNSEYSLELLISKSKKHFTEHRIYQSNPDTRTIIKFWNV